VFLAALASAVLGSQLGAFSVVLQTHLSGRSELPFAAFAMVMQPIHLAIGVVEGVITAGVVNYVRSVRPELLENAAAPGAERSAVPLRELLITFAVLTVIAGGFLSWFASTHPDGLEWSLERVMGKRGLPEQQQGVARSLKDLQDRTALMPEYGFKQTEGERRGEGPTAAWPGADTGTSVAGILGAALVLALVVLAGTGIRSLRRRRSRPAAY
jgi:cobalt/nickel transport system permease protein